MLKENEVQSMLDIFKTESLSFEQVYSKFIQTFDRMSLFSVGLCISDFLKNNYFTQLERLNAYYILQKCYYISVDRVNPFVEIFIKDLQYSQNTVEIEFLKQIALDKKLEQYTKQSSKSLIQQYKKNINITRYDVDILIQEFNSLYPMPPFIREQGVSSSFSLFTSLSTNIIYISKRPTTSLTSTQLHQITTGESVSFGAIEPEIPDIQPALFPLDNKELLWLPPSLSCIPPRSPYFIGQSFNSVPENPPYLLTNYCSNLSDETKAINIMKKAISKQLTDKEIQFICNQTSYLSSYCMSLYNTPITTFEESLLSMNNNNNNNKIDKNKISPEVQAVYDQLKLLLTKENISALIQNNLILAESCIYYMIVHNIKLDFCYTLLLSLPLSYDGIEFMAGLSAVIQFPQSFLHTWTRNTISQLQSIKDRNLQTRLVRSFCLYIHTCVQNQQFNLKEMEDILYSFFSNVKNCKEISLIYKDLA
ncbi:hypothetical protein WA158_007710 [Blastocystis sp. Blastoise]